MHCVGHYAKNHAYHGSTPDQGKYAFVVPRCNLVVVVLGMFCDWFVAFVVLLFMLGALTLTAPQCTGFVISALSKA